MMGTPEFGENPSSRDRLSEVIIESLGDGVLIIDANGLIHRHNQRFLEMWGLESIPLGCLDSLTLAGAVKDQMKDPGTFLDQIREFASRENENDQLDLLEFKDGRILERRQRSLGDQGLELGRLLVFRDVTAQLKAEKSNRTLALQVQATQRLESLGVLAGGLAHEFNNLLMAILGNADLLEIESHLTSDGQAHLSEIRRASRRAADLCNQMLTYSGKGEFYLQKLDLAGVVKEMRGILDVTLGKKVALTCDFQKDLPLILGDVAQMRQVILNLVGNAADACLADQGGQVALRLFASHCDRSILDGCLSGSKAEPGLYICLEVADTGCGLSREQQARVFDPFYTTKFVGRGMGLSAVLGIAMGHGGAVCVKSQPNQGSAFSVFLPVAPSGD
jgi:signal transduction histidine kinase